MSDPVISRGEVLGLILKLATLTTVSYYTMRLLIDALDPTRKQRLAAAKQAELMLSRLGIQPDVKLNEHEMMIASQLVDPASVQVKFEDIAGHGELIKELRQTVILPIQKRKLFAGSELLSAPKGVLLHGPPGCGKTMCAKAIAREAGARFINLDISSLTDKRYGESEKIAGAVFTLAKKIQPCIIFIDEIDSLLRVRSQQEPSGNGNQPPDRKKILGGLEEYLKRSLLFMPRTPDNHAYVVRAARNYMNMQDPDGWIAVAEEAAEVINTCWLHVVYHEATSMIKAQFLQLWDGMATDKGQCVLILGATNRPKDVDAAILRRMPATFRLGLPDLGQRKEILRAVLRLEKIGESVDLIRLAELTEGWSGSDLRELCRAGAVQRVKELGAEEQELRPISMEDMLTALGKMRESRLDIGQQ